MPPRRKSKRQGSGMQFGAFFRPAPLTPMPLALDWNSLRAFHQQPRKKAELASLPLPDRREMHAPEFFCYLIAREPLPQAAMHGFLMSPLLIVRSL